MTVRYFMINVYIFNYEGGNYQGLTIRLLKAMSGDKGIFNKRLICPSIAAVRSLI